MHTMGPLALTSRQLTLLTDAARTVAPEWRQRFVQAVADELTGRETTDAAMARAIGVALDRMERAA